MGYIDAGDRVVLTEGIATPAHARMARPDLVGKHGLITHNDGWGRCEVHLDDGGYVTAWNGLDLERESEVAA